MALINGEINHSPLPEVSGREAEAVFAEAEREILPNTAIVPVTIAPPIATIRPHVQDAMRYYPRILPAVTPPIITQPTVIQPIISQVFMGARRMMPPNIAIVPVSAAPPLITIRPRPTVQDAMRYPQKILPAATPPTITQHIYTNPIIPQVFIAQPIYNQPIIAQSCVQSGSGTLSGGGRKRMAAPTHPHVKPKKAKSGCRKYNALLIF
jgi:hypothetical protein